MRDPSLEPWQRDRPFGLDRRQAGNRGTIAVAAAPHPPKHDEARLPGDAGIVHTTVAIHRAPEAVARP
jgi:hypothetical protein